MTVERDERVTEDDGWTVPALSDRDHEALADHIHSPETARRCRIVLLALDGWSDTAVADQLGVSTGVVTWWKDQFATGGIAALISRTGGTRRGAGLARSPDRAPERGARARTSRTALGAAPPGSDPDRQVCGQSTTRPGTSPHLSLASRPAHGDREWTFTVRPALDATGVELIGAFVSPQARVAGLLEVPEAALAGRRRVDAGPEASIRAPATEAGSITWLPEGQPIAHQLDDFLRLLQRSAPTRRLRVVTDNAAVLGWLRSRRSRDSSVHVVAHLAADSRSWLGFVDAVASTPTGSAEVERLGDVVRRLRRSVRPFRWVGP